MSRGAEAPNMRMRPVWASSNRPAAWAKASTISSSGRLAAGAEIGCGHGDGGERRRQSRVQRLVAGPAEPLRLHAAAEEIEAQIEIAGIFGIEAEEAHGRRAQALGRRRGARNGALDRLAEAGEGVAQHLGIDRLLGIEVEIKRGRGIAGRRGDGAQAGAVQPLGLEDAPGRRQDQAALQLADRLLPSLPPIAHGISSHT